MSKTHKTDKDTLVNFASLTSSTYVKCWVVNIYWMINNTFSNPVEARWVSASRELRCNPALKKNRNEMGSQLRDTYYTTEEAAWLAADRLFKEWYDQRRGLIERRGQPLIKTRAKREHIPY